MLTWRHQEGAFVSTKSELWLDGSTFMKQMWQKTISFINRIIIKDVFHLFHPQEKVPGLLDVGELQKLFAGHFGVRKDSCTPFHPPQISTRRLINYAVLKNISIDDGNNPHFVFFVFRWRTWVVSSFPSCTPASSATDGCHI